ncbi:trifunctional serine/threonine-protein kinase/ATP-binding protein/sensor histidine kinase [Bradyrhizobium iriomotense]|uniref:histidine kinase n=1 Tax=Bradyrhizobium iriomotense TaxID=441950 RepID=A0ABQ6AP76_9BRAD|nr:ATP-binding sensor histidine kinase [Bradyrhizobium iriomotense]GLR84067.1 serine/threonine protein kinase [Bradyrhizobium iriomotense]
MTDLANYIVETLWEDEQFVLSRRVSRDKHSSLLVSTPASVQPTMETVARLNHAYALRDELDSAWAARPVALESRDGRPALLIEDPGGEVLARLIGTPWDLKPFLYVAIGLAVSLGRLHNRGFIHKDVKPSNILVNIESRDLWLVGFGIASRLPRERRTPEPPEIIAGTLAYMAPEQTGRMNRSIDSRSDLYSLGITLYEILTGTLPFTASDPMEWIHCHIARQPAPPDERTNGIPAPVAAIVMKLLAKTAEDRYQTAAGVESDLRRCLAESDLHGRIRQFALGENDTPDRLLVPEKLYGRAREVDTLLASFDRVVKSGKPELVLVSGYSGIGKSAVVNELHKPLVPPRGLFASGKFDQYKRDIPYATLAQAFQSLIRPLLSKPEEELSKWRSALREALDPNGQLMVDLVPELKAVVGEQPPVPELPQQEAQHRFNLVFRRFIGVFARPEHPLALFLDDLQWLDAATLDLIEELLTQPDVKHLMLIGAYRDNEVGPTHPLPRKLQAMRDAGALLKDIVLAPLTRENLEQLIADSLHCEPQHAGPLAELVHDKTTGNPFFAIQFISTLFEQDLLTFDQVKGRWSWDLNRIHAKGYTDNVVDLMVWKLTRLAPQTQDALKQLACLGNSAGFMALHLVYQDSMEKMHAQLAEAVGAGFVFQSKDSYRFVHDRVQEAAYSLIPEARRAEAHLRIGRLLASHIPPSEREEGIFEIVNQLNRGAALISSRGEKEQLAEFNLIAGKRAKASTAYVSALRYFVAGTALLEDDGWEYRQDLKFALEMQRAECEFLTGEYALAEKHLLALLGRAATVVDRAAVTRLRLALYLTLDRPDRAIEVGLEYLRHVGIEWSPQPSEEDVRQELQRMRQLLDSRAIEQLIDLPLMSDLSYRATMDVLSNLFAPTLLTDSNLYDLVVLRMTTLSLEHGNYDASCYAYSHINRVLGFRFGDYQTALRFGQLACDLVAKRGLDRFEARVYASFGAFAVPWVKDLSASRTFIRRGFEMANASGDLTYAIFGFKNLITNLLVSGEPLEEVHREAEQGLAIARKARFGFAVDWFTAQLMLIRSLRGSSLDLDSPDNAGYGDSWFERHLEEDPPLALCTCTYWMHKLQACVLAQDYPAGIDAAARAAALLWSTRSFLEAADYHFYAALSRAAACDSANGEERTQHFDALLNHHRQLTVWTENCPSNFANRAGLVSAEIARLEGRDLDAMRFYDGAIRSAREHGFIQNEGIANELAARFYATRSFETISNAYLRNARHCYLRWGADAKVRQLDRLYGYLGGEPALPHATSTISTPIEQLDFATVIKVSHAVSGEMVLEKLIDRLMRTAIEHAGAQRGVLILRRADDLQIAAEATTSGDAIIVSPREASITPAGLPESVVHYVVRTQESVILNDASAENPFSSDVYVREHHARSILCLPLINRAKLIGVLYLENNLTPHVFTSARIAVLEPLASQAAISLENARLYRDAQQMEAYLKAAQTLSHTGSFGWRLGTGEIVWSEETYQITGYDRGTKPTLELIFARIHPEDVASVQDALDRTTQNGTDLDFEHRFLLPDGSVRYVHVVANAIRDESGDIEYVGAIMDITERKQAEDALRKSQGELAHVARVMTMGELVTSIAHEINQPLASVVTSATACLRWLDAEKLGEARRSATRAIAEGHRASEIIGRIRALANKAPPRKDRIDVNETILEVIALARGEMQRNGVALETQLSEHVPVILADRVQLQQVILNLIVNAIEAMNGVSEGLRVLLVRSGDDDTKHVVISVQDSGPGLDPSSLEHLFDAFYTTKPHGLGMGLSISRSIIDAHGGRLWATANVPQGAIFQFTLPIGGERAA